ncbi:MAG: methylenetetrahydrofolate reductase [NAD(P)H] [Legionellales bacterium]|nr:methylenetetrahydrofolate reductase [NAD(P)H] [Legionellales bacterium]|tara:strand:- start:2973 stop:3833 length:861 start_codon:yes stop_codon:yes gene_type:complete
MESQKQYKPKFSFEFFPPKTRQAVEKLQMTTERLAQLNPSFFSVTFGAGGSTRERTFETVMDIFKKTGIDGVPHVSCVGSTLEEIQIILDSYIEGGIRNVVALRGDLPSGSIGGGPLRYASELVEFIRRETGDHFHIEVAAYPEFHPQALSAQKDLENFKRKIDAGADAAITQYFYNPDAYYRFIDSCEKLKINIPIVPGIMPIVTCTQLCRFSDACGAEIPRWILKRLQEFGDDRASIQEFGIDVTTKLCEELLANGAPGLHFYTMNQSEASVAILKNIGINMKD